jgi:hypothetical protein
MFTRTAFKGTMFKRTSFGTVALAAALMASTAATRAHDETKYPDWKGEWIRIDGLAGGSFDPSKRPGRAQEPPVTAAARTAWEANMEEIRRGGQNYNTQVRCLPGGMPRMMIAYQPLEMIVTPEVTHVHITFFGEHRRIFTDGREWPKKIIPSFSGYSIGQWRDENGDGRLDTLDVETRGLKGPRIFDPSGIPLADDNLTVTKERIYLDRENPDILRDELTVFDNALTRPWSVIRGYARGRDPVWHEDSCAENNQYVFIHGESYLKAADGRLMPTRKDQPAPDLKFFSQAQK